MGEEIIINSITIDCGDPKALSDFYMRLLQWEKTYEDESFISLKAPSGNIRIGFQKNEYYIPPVWPETPGTQQQQVHLDFKARDKEHMNKLVEYAIQCGAKKAEMQYSDLWTVMLDPVGHPFCFDTL